MKRGLRAAVSLSLRANLMASRDLQPPWTALKSSSLTLSSTPSYTLPEALQTMAVTLPGKFLPDLVNFACEGSAFPRSFWPKQGPICTMFSSSLKALMCQVSRSWCILHVLCMQQLRHDDYDSFVPCYTL